VSYLVVDGSVEAFFVGPETALELLPGQDLPRIVLEESPAIAMGPLGRILRRLVPNLFDLATLRYLTAFALQFKDVHDPQSTSHHVFGM
jgi:hypothetical protein